MEKKKSRWERETAPLSCMPNEGIFRTRQQLSYLYFRIMSNLSLLISCYIAEMVVSYN